MSAEQAATARPLAGSPAAPPPIRAGVSEAARRADVAGLLDHAVVPRLTELPSPTFVMLDAVVDANLDEYAGFLDAIGVGFLASVKACTLDFVVRRLAARTHGLDVSSLAEARLVRAFTAGAPVPLHFTSPSLALASWEAIADETDAVNLNSLEMLARVAPRWGARACRLGLRVNPGVSSAKDARYDPARSGSRLGVPAARFEGWLAGGDVPPALTGLHFHTACEARSFAATVASLAWLGRVAAPLRGRLAHVNLGGGWLRPSLMAMADELAAAVAALARDTGAEVLAEPGNGLVRDAGVLVTRVIDVVETGAGRVAILDAQVAHAPEVYEYGWAPDVHVPGNPVVPEDAEGWTYELAGCSCLAGDRFGVYRFRRPLELGDPVCFHDLGAYALAKASPFNGLLVPAVARVTTDGALAIVKPPGADAYHQLWSTRPS